MKAPRSAWRVRLQVALWRQGSAGAALLAVLLVTAGLLAWCLRQTDAALAQARSASAHEVGPTPGDPGRVRADDDANSLSALQTVLMASPTPDEVVRDMAALSRRMGIVWAQGDYRSQWHADTQTTQWQVTQPLNATYPQVRQLIEAVLRAQPNVSLDQVAVQRDDATQAQVKVRLRWSIWTRDAAAQR